jgi:hypothetical protein
LILLWNGSAFNKSAVANSLRTKHEPFYSSAVLSVQSFQTIVISPPFVENSDFYEKTKFPVYKDTQYPHRNRMPSQTRERGAEILYKPAWRHSTEVRSISVFLTAILQRYLQQYGNQTIVWSLVCPFPLPYCTFSKLYAEYGCSSGLVTHEPAKSSWKNSYFFFSYDCTHCGLPD